MKTLSTVVPNPVFWRSLSSVLAGTVGGSLIAYSLQLTFDARYFSFVPVFAVQVLLFTAVAVCLVYPLLLVGRGTLPKTSASIVYGAGMIAWLAVVLVLGLLSGVHVWAFFAIPGLLVACGSLALLTRQRSAD